MSSRNKEMMKDKPLVSYCLFTYNQEAYVRESLEAALAQSYSPLEIVVSDDCSSDGTVSVLREVIAAYSGDHHVKFNVNEENLGIGGHVSKVLLELCSGEYFVLVGGDDISSPDHVKLAVDAIQAYSNVYALDFAASIIDEQGAILQADNSPKGAFNYCLEDFISMKKNIPTFAPGRIIRRDLMRKFPPISSSCPTEDSVLVLRSLILGGLRREPMNLIQYRRAHNSVSSPINLKKLSVEGIINQYYADVDSAAATWLIDEGQAKRLRRRIAFEHLKRKMFVQNSGGWFVTVFIKIKFKILKLLYLSGLPIGPQS